MLGQPQSYSQEQQLQLDNDKASSSRLYLNTHAVIELVEVSPPPPRRLSSVIHSASYASSSSEDDDDEELSDMEDEEEQDPEEDTASYCSSDFPMAEQATPTKPEILHTDSFKGSMKRILLWREASLSGDSTSLKRKLSEFDDSIPTVPESHTSKRSRSSSSSSSSSSASSHAYFSQPTPEMATALAHRRYSNTSSISSAELEMHPCPACDAFFPTLSSLRAHGKATGNEACCVAVEYAFEQ